MVSMDSILVHNDKVEGKPYTATVYRYESPNRVSTTWDHHPGNIGNEHRYTKEGVGGTYAGTSKETASKEIQNYVTDISDKVVVTKQVELKNVLDLTDSNVRQKLGVTYKDITGSDYTKTHKIGDWAKANGFDGILAPSARHKNGSNIVILKNE